ncbi:thiopeptide-type bacteriocin biosynthesis protein [Natronosporangium hydrolyticum]|uniref:Thiopeptide-type bacteriocin biosynthesis protein n=1 Tax=Natronosporangium hydrolyticum TaxID=2811111 RepID=A0A895Y590_9ACTN|nr:thiopeptide-type bacteriocin biosynthesis protein [Natronosporangium hydrolyticum]QSB12857.1 thiopeptide-type bacteriocin biosynthesis protein [Natronosporangium hydrolyticum]
MTPPLWRQFDIEFPDYSRAEPAAVTHLAPLLTTTEADGLIDGWWFIRKRPCWRMRYLPTDNPPTIQEHLRAALGRLQQAQHITRATEVIYEPETRAFGGPEAMAVAHQLWHRDSRNLLAHLAATTDEPARHRRELPLLLYSTMLRAAGLDWYEQGDVWARVARSRPPAAVGDRPNLTATMRRLLTVDTDDLTRSSRATAGLADWTAAYADAGRNLARLNAGGFLERGLRHVLAHHIVFAFNRIGLPAATQAVLAATASEVFFDDPPQPQHPRSASAGLS